MITNVSASLKATQSPTKSNRFSEFKASCKESSPLLRDGAISLRVDQPIESCQAAAHAFYRNIDGERDDQKSRIQFSWFRSALKRGCTNAECPRQGPGNVVLLDSKIECLLCCEMGLPREDACFCSTNCFKMAWKEHKRMHENVSSRTNICKTKHSVCPWESQPGELRQQEPEEQKWIDLNHSKRIYVPKKDDVGYLLRVECRVIRGDNSGINSKFVETNIVLPFPASPPKRQMLANSSEEGLTPRYRQLGVFRVLSYNVLAELYATRQMYPYCPMWVLSWSFRKVLLRNELQSYGADILCLQEVQGDHYKNYFEPMMTEWGYDGWFLKKTREDMSTEGKVDGCALFYKRNRFIMKERHSLEFNNSASELAESFLNEFDSAFPSASNMEREAIQTDLVRLRYRLMRDNVSQIAILEAVPANMETSRKAQSGPLLCIANVHIFSNPKYPDVKMWQTLTLIRKLQHLTSPRNLPLVLCGDFNSEPSSAVYEFLSKSHVSLEHEQLQPLVDVFRRLGLTHQIPLASSYSRVFGSEPEYTNFTGHWVGVLDYVWFTPSQLSLFAALKVHSTDTLKEYSKTPLPNCQFVSDHVPLAFDFSFKSAV